MKRWQRAIAGVTLIFSTIIAAIIAVNWSWMQGLQTGKSLGAFGIILVVTGVMSLAFGFISILSSIPKDKA